MSASDDQQTRAVNPGKLTRIKDVAIAISSVFSAVAIPVVGYWFSSALKNREIEGKFVELAVQILKAEPTDSQRNLREWAIAVINNYSGVPLSHEVSSDLINKIVIPSSPLDRRTASTVTTLKPKAAQLALQLVEKAKQKGIEIKIISGFRTIEEQEELYAQGRTKPGQIITQAKRSVHNTGLAFDIGIFKDGLYVDESPDYDVVGQIGKSIGLVWGGDLPTRDTPHFETPDAQEAVRKLK